jgi:hypothetical protein
MTSGTPNFVPVVSATRVDRPIVHVVSGRENALRLSGLLLAFSERCGQPGAMQDLAYFLSKPGAMARIPHLLLVSRTPNLDAGDPNLEDLFGLLLIFEYRPWGVATGAFATNDRSGRNTLIAMPQYRSQVVELCILTLLRRDAHLILISFRSEDGLAAGTVGEPEPPIVRVEGRGAARWAKRTRTIPGYLPLSATFDATLAKIGQRTRSNLRYYRRRAETRLGCVFLPEIAVTREEVLAFNRECMYAVPAKVIGWRYDSLKELARPVLMGIRDRDGRWLSMLGGRRYDDRSEILWQLNRDGFATDSLSTVMRSYFIEHEISRGSRRLYIEGGTPHPIRLSFVPEDLIDLVVVRHTPVARVMEKIARHYISPDNELSQMLCAQELEWFPC